MTFLLNLRIYWSCSEDKSSVWILSFANCRQKWSFSARIFTVERITKIAGSGMSQTVEVSCAKMCQVSMTWVGTFTTSSFFPTWVANWFRWPTPFSCQSCNVNIVARIRRGSESFEISLWYTIQKHFFMLNLGFGWMFLPVLVDTRTLMSRVALSISFAKCHRKLLIPIKPSPSCTKRLKVQAVESVCPSGSTWLDDTRCHSGDPWPSVLLNAFQYRNGYRGTPTKDLAKLFNQTSSQHNYERFLSAF